MPAIPRGARAVILREKIVSLGGEPANQSGVAGVWSKLVERGAAAISDDMAIVALEQGEGRVLHDYRAKLSEVPPDVPRLPREPDPARGGAHSPNAERPQAPHPVGVSLVGVHLPSDVDETTPSSMD